MCLRISSLYRILSPPLQRAFTRVTFGFCHVRESGGIQPPRQKDFTAQDTGSCSSLALNFGWRWFFTDSLGFIWQFLDLLFRQQQTALEGSISCSSQTCQCRIHPHSQAKPSHRESSPCRAHSLWITRQIQAPRAAAFAKLAYPITPELPLVERISGWPWANCTSPSAIPTSQHIHRTRAGIRGSKNDTKPPLPHLNMTYAKSSLAGAEDQGP